MTSDTQVEFDRSILGLVMEKGPFPVTRERMLAFTRAVGETNPIYTDDEAARAAGYDSIIAPPTFVNVYIMTSGRPDPKIKHGKLSFHAGQALENHIPVKPGDTLMIHTSLEDVYAKTGRAGTMAFAVWKTEITNQDGKVVAVARESFVRR